MNNEVKKKKRICETATRRYIENNHFTIQSLADELDMSSAEIFELFPNRKAILLYFYQSRIYNYKEQVHSLKDYADFSLSEKLSNLFLSLLDDFLEYREFILQTYRKLIANAPLQTTFEREFKNEIKTIFKSDNQISSSASIFINRLLFNTIYCHFHALILFWSNDESRTFEQSYALVDKWCSLIQELFYNKILDKGFDFGKFLFYNSPFKNAFSTHEHHKGES